MKLCSACLLGINCKWDGKSKPNIKLIELFRKGELIPVCPEQLGGLTTPRTPAEQRGDKVYTKDGKDVTEQFNRGAEETLKIAKMLNIKEFIGKARSPSCGSGKIYDGAFSGTLIDGDGVTVSLLKKNGIKVITDENY